MSSKNWRKMQKKQVKTLNRDLTFIVQFYLQQNMWHSRGI